MTTTTGLPGARQRQVPRARLGASGAVCVIIGVSLVWQFPQLRGMSIADVVAVALVAWQTVTLTVRTRALSWWHFAFGMLLAVHVIITSGAAEWASDWGVINRFVGFGFLVLFYLAVAGTVRHRDQALLIVRWVIVGSVALGLVFVLAGLLHLSPAGVESFTAGGRLNGASWNAGGYAAYLAALFSATMAFNFYGTPVLRAGLVDLGLAALLAGLVVLTASRSGFIGVACGLLFLLVWRIGSDRSRRLVTLLRLVVVAPVVVLLAWQVSAAVEYENPLDRQFTIDVRMQSNAGAWDAFLASPVLGNGLGSYFGRTGDFVHNTVLWLLTDLGVLGLLVGLGMGWWMFRRTAWGAAPGEVVPPEQLAAGAPLRAALAAGVAAYVGVSLGVEISYQRGLWFLLALGVGSWLARER